MFYQIEHISTPEHFVVEKNCNYSFPPHIHQCFEVITINEGAMNVTVDEKTYTLNKNESIFIFPNQIHSLDSTESMHTLCIFSPDFVKQFSGKTDEKIPENNKFILDDEMIKLFDKLEENNSDIFRKGVLYLICDSFNKQAVYRYQEKDKRNLLYTIFTFVDRNFDGNCSLSDLSNECGYNYSYISRYFKSVVGISYNEYVNNYRLNHSCYLIKNNSGSILKCALDSGFDSLRTFNRSFKERYGITPTEYKKLISKTE